MSSVFSEAIGDRSKSEKQHPRVLKEVLVLTKYKLRPKALTTTYLFCVATTSIWAEHPHASPKPTFIPTSEHG